MFILTAMLLLIVGVVRFVAELAYDDWFEDISVVTRTLYSLLNCTMFCTSLFTLAWLMFAPEHISVALGFLLASLAACTLSFLMPPFRAIDNIIDSRLFHNHSPEKEKK